jgi:predicted transcriptional regulator YheO
MTSAVSCRTRSIFNIFLKASTSTVEAIFQDAVREVGKHRTTMSIEEKHRLIALLKENGIIQLKGAEEQVARRMGVTRFSVYNDLKKVRITNALN